MLKTGKIRVQWGHLILLVAIAGFVLAYLLDARATSMRASNLLLVQPVAILAMVLLLIVLPQCFYREPPAGAAEAQDAPAQKPRESLLDLAKIGILTAAFVILAFVMERIGFDIAVFGFLILGIYICGERNWVANIAFSAIFTVLLIYGYGAIIPFPFPLAVL